MTTPGRDVYVSAAQAAFLTGRAPATIRAWAARGHLHAAARWKNRTLYRASDVLDAERETRRRTNRPRQGTP